MEILILHYLSKNNTQNIPPKTSYTLTDKQKIRDSATRDTKFSYKNPINRHYD